MFVRMRTINRRDADEVVGAPDVTDDVTVLNEVEDAPGLEETGLTSIEDIVGEMIVNGEIDPHSVGMTEEQAQKISRKSRYVLSAESSQKPFPNTLVHFTVSVVALLYSVFISCAAFINVHVSYIFPVCNFKKNYSDNLISVTSYSGLFCRIFRCI